MARIKKGDVVTVLSGKERGKTGKVLQVWPEEQLALVEHLNLMKNFERPTQQNQAGGVIAREAPLPLAKLTLSCPQCRRPTRVGWRLNPSGEKQRVCARCEEPL